MRLLTIVTAVLMFATPATAQHNRPDSLNTFAMRSLESDSAGVAGSGGASSIVIRYPVAKHTLYGTVTGAALLGSLAGIVSVLCSSPTCPRLGPALMYGGTFGAAVGAAVGAVSGVNTPIRTLRPQ
jgi:hypothetical protein